MLFERGDFMQGENPMANNQIEEINVVLNEIKDGQELL